MPTLIRGAPAKINLYLRVTSRRPDGYHELDSLLLPLSLADQLSITLGLADASAVACVCPDHPELDGDQNLAARAARAYLDLAGRQARVQISLRKQCWVAAGLGGGSSDAAAVLLVLQQQLRALAPQQLARLARELGADVPFFLDPRPCRARGVGHLLTPLSGVPALDLVLVNPGQPLSTAAVYQALGLTPGETTTPGPSPAAITGLESAARAVANSLEPAALSLLPEIARLKQATLAAGALAAGMSGSGPTVFGLFEDAWAARRAALLLRRQHGWRAVAARTVGSE